METDARLHFLANVCHVCKSKSTPYACEICRMIFYCSPQHRRQNWCEHSELCWAVSKITKNRPSLWELFDGKDFTKFRHGVASKCTELLRRSLKWWELEMIYYPRMCDVCRDFNWTNLSPCKNCEFTYTCQKNHFRKDHVKWCKTIKIYSDLIVSRSTGVDIKPFRLELKNKNPKSMAEVLKQNLAHNKEFENVQLRLVLTSELLTYPLTVLHGLKVIKALQKKALVVLFIGAEIQAEVEPVNKWEKYLLHFLDDVENLNLKFLGPELRQTNQEFFGSLCEKCRKRKKTLKFQFISGKFYHQYSPNGTERPDLICALNSGMYREFGFENKNSWKETIEKLFLRGSPPVLVTEYTFQELKMVLERIESLCGNVAMITGPEINPFASLKPGLNIISVNEIPVIFKNYYYTLLMNNK